MTPKKYSVDNPDASPNFRTKVLGGIVDKIINFGSVTGTINIFHNPGLKSIAGVIAAATFVLATVSTYRIFVPAQLSINLPSKGFLINNLPPPSLDKQLNASERRRLQELVDNYRRMVEQNPNDAIARTNLGEALRRLGDLAGALREQGKALQIDPNLQAAKLGIALIKRDQGDFESAKQGIQKALTQNRSATAYLCLGQTLYEQRDYKGAEIIYRKALAIEPNAITHHVLAVVLHVQSKYEEAIVQYREAIRLDPNNSNAHYNLGNVLHNQGKYEEAIAHYQATVQINPDNADAHANLGIALKNQGKKENAVLEWKTAKALYEKQGNALRVTKMNELLR